MRKLLSIFILLTISFSSFAQEVELGTIFTIEFSNPERNMDFKIVAKNPYNKLIETNLNMDSIFPKRPKENQIVGVFANGKFGTKVSPILLLVSGMEDYLDYYLRIKIPSKNKFQKTSSISLFKGVKSIEHWPYQIEKIAFKKFKILPKQNIEIFQFKEKIDSTCIKNSAKTIEFGEKEFKAHLKLAISEFHNNKNFELGKMTEYENSINSEDVSLGHFWTLGEGIYPNEKGFKFGNPKSYRRIECPYFEGKSSYFYTKENKNIKVVSFNWETFKESNFGINPEIKNDVNEKFNEKFEYILKTVNSLLGNPIENITEESGQIKIRWKNQKGINAYLFNFGNYNEIRLYVYKE